MPLRCRCDENQLNIVLHLTSFLRQHPSLYLTLGCGVGFCLSSANDIGHRNAGHSSFRQSVRPSVLPSVRPTCERDILRTA